MSSISMAVNEECKDAELHTSYYVTSQQFVT